MPDGEQQFLILGNGRTGSTWLLTSLDRLPGVIARHEIKWKDPSLEFRADAHFVVDKNSSMAAAIKRVTVDPNVTPKIRGSKLIFNPYYFNGPDVFANLAKVIEPNTKLILLKRNYLETWLSWKTRGVYHVVDEEVGHIDPAVNPLLDAMRKLEKPATIHLVLHHCGGALSEAEGRPYPLVTAIDDLMQFFSNDIQLLSLVKQRGGLVVDYADIASQLGRIAEFIGAPASKDIIENIVGKPRTLKLDRLDDYLHPIGTLQNMAEAMDRAFQEAVAGNSGQAWKWTSEDTGAVGAPNVVRAIEPFGYPATNNAINWKIQRPVAVE